MSTDDAPGDPGWDDLDAETKHEILALANTINDDPSKVTRRDLLAGAGAVGAGALLGGGATQALSEPAAASHGGANIGTSSDPIEMIHTEGLSSLQSLDTDDLNSVVFVSPGDDLQSRFDAAPAGGLVVFEPGDHDVATMGTATKTEPVDVYMPGGRRGDSTDGAVLVNDGADSVGGPILEFKSASVGTYSSRPRYSVHELNIVHEGSGEAVLYNEYEGTVIRPRIFGGNSGDHGLRFQNDSFSTLLFQPLVTNFNQHAYFDEATGGSYVVFGGTLDGGRDGSSATAHIECPHMWYGGQLSGGGSYGIEVLSDGSRMYGTRIENPSTGIRVGDAANSVRGDDNRFHNMYFASIDQYCVDFENSVSNRLNDPIRLIDGGTSGAAARWQADSIRDGVVGSYKQLAGKSWTIASGASRVIVDFLADTKINDTLRGNITQPVEGMEIYNQTDGNKNIYNGADWILPDGTVT